MTDAKIADITSLSDIKFTKAEIDLISRAFYFAQSAHDGQKRASGEPYFNHVVATAKNLARYEMDATTISAGLLHDVVEDTEIKEAELEKNFGKEILTLVEGVTKLGKLKYHGEERHVESLRKFFMASAKDVRVVMIKLSDRLHNLQTLEHVKPEKRKRIALESIEVYAPLANRLGIGKLRGEIEDAAFPFAYPEEYEKVTQILKEKAHVNQSYLEKIDKELEKELIANKIRIVKIEYRIKHKFSLWKKLKKYDFDLDRIYDLVALRVIVGSVTDCYRVLGVIHQVWRPLPGRIKDYIALPKLNGYQSIHTTIFTGDGNLAEIQIRTKEMHAQAEYGVASHVVYKQQSENSKTPEDPKFKWMKQFKNLGNEGVEDPGQYLKSLKLDTFSDRIFVFTPKGDVIDLPEGSSAIDFAYSIHSDVGDHLSQVKINGKIEKIYAQLKSGDIVNVISAKNATPSSKWLEFTKTTVAKKHINSYLKDNSLLQKFLSFGKK